MKYNILHVISDQHLARCMGCAGHAQAITPNMDRLAASGTRFANAYTQNPICTPSRVSILSGQYVHNHGYYGLGGPTPDRLEDFLGHFRGEGYKTAAIGKLHLPDKPIDWLLKNQSVDVWRDCYRRGVEGLQDAGHPRMQSAYYDYLDGRDLRELEDSNKVLPEFPGGQNVYYAKPSRVPFEHCVEKWCVDQATRVMDQSGDEPWCMQVSFPRPHQYYTPDQQFWDMYDDDLELPKNILNSAEHRPPHFRERTRSLIDRPMDQFPQPTKTWEQGAKRIWKGYLACLTQVDHCLGLLMDALEKRGIADRTIIIYHSDHGAYSTSFGLPEKAPGICSDHICRVPMLWHVPGQPAGQVCDQLVENIDLAPTICALCDLPAMDAADGRDISSLLAGSDQPVREQAVTEHPWSKSIRFGPWRYVHYPKAMFGEDVGELYNIDADPDETNNLYHDPEHAHVVSEARQRLLDFFSMTTRFHTNLPNQKKYGSDGKQIIRLNEDGQADLPYHAYL